MDDFKEKAIQEFKSCLKIVGGHRIKSYLRIIYMLKKKKSHIHTLH